MVCYRQIALAIVAALLVIATAVVVAVAVKKYDGYFEGFWVGDPEYLLTANLSDFQLYLGPSSSSGRQGYIFMTDSAGGIVANTAIVFNDAHLVLRGTAAARNLFRSRDSNSSRVEVIGNGTTIPFPPLMTATISMSDGTLTLHDDKTVYAFLGKDASVSAAALALS